MQACTIDVLLGPVGGGDDADLCQRAFWWRLPQGDQKAWPVQKSNLLLLRSGQSAGRQEGTTAQTTQQGEDISYFVRLEVQKKKVRC